MLIPAYLTLVFVRGAIRREAILQIDTDGACERTPSAPEAIAPTLIAGTTSRVLTLGADHGITTADTVSIFWTDTDDTDRLRSRMAVTATDATTITVTAASGAGDTLFTDNDTAAVVGRERALLLEFAAASLKMFVAMADREYGRGAVLLLDSDGELATSAPINIAAGGGSWWAEDCGFAFDLSADVASAAVASGTAGLAAELLIVPVIDATPGA